MPQMRASPDACDQPMTAMVPVRSGLCLRVTTKPLLSSPGRFPPSRHFIARSGHLLPAITSVRKRNSGTRGTKAAVRGSTTVSWQDVRSVDLKSFVKTSGAKACISLPR